MIILYVLLMFGQSLGGFFHEAVGLVIGILFLIHIFLNCSMLKGLFKSVKNRKLKKIILFASDVVLTICMPIVIITGMLIAKELFVIQSGISRMRLFDIHNILSYICLGIMILHILLHTKYLLGVLKKLPSSMSKKEMISAISIFLAGVIAVVILYSSLAIYKGNNKNCSKNHNSINIKNNSSTAPKNNFDNYTESISPVIDEDSESDNEDITTSITENSDNEDTTTSITENSDNEDTTTSITENSDNEDTTTSITENSDNEDTTISITENTDTEISVTTDNDTSPPPTLEEYLSKLKCTGCGRECFLLNPRCKKGKMQASQAEEEYNQIYNN